MCPDVWFSKIWSHISCNTVSRVLPDMYALALGHRAYISGNALLTVLQLLHKALFVVFYFYFLRN